MTASPCPLVVAVSGASGAIYATRLLELLRAIGQDVHLTISPPAALVIQQELGLNVRLDSFSIDQLLPVGTTAFDHCRATAESPADKPALAMTQVAAEEGRITYHRYDDFMAPIASGSSITSGMVVCPCSGGTMSATVTGASNNLIHRAIEVHLKEHRRLVLVPREMPLSQVALDNMQRAGMLGATVLPASPGWYHGVDSARDLVDHVVSRILDQFGLANTLIERWGD